LNLTLHNWLLITIESQTLPPIQIMERRLKIGIHNTWKFINDNGSENSVILTLSNDKIGGDLNFKGVLPVDNYFFDESIGFIMELVYISKLI